MFRIVGVLLILSFTLQFGQGIGSSSSQTTTTSTSADPPTIVLRPNETTAGTTIVVSGNGFTPNWTAWIFSPDFGDEVCCFMTSSAGSFEVNYTLLSNLQPGVYTIRAVDQKINTADAKITIVSQATTSAVPQFPGSGLAALLLASLVAVVLLFRWTLPPAL